MPGSSRCASSATSRPACTARTPTGWRGALARSEGRGSPRRGRCGWTAQEGSRRDCPGGGRSAHASAVRLCCRGGPGAAVDRRLRAGGRAFRRPGSLWNVTGQDAYRRLDSDAAHDSARGVLLHRRRPPCGRRRTEPAAPDPGPSRGSAHAARRPPQSLRDAGRRRPARWYNDTVGASQEQTTARLPDRGGWGTSRIDVTAPARACGPALHPVAATGQRSEPARDRQRAPRRLGQPGCDYLQAGGPIRQAALPPLAPRRRAPVTATTLPVTPPPALPAPSTSEEPVDP